MIEPRDLLTAVAVKNNGDWDKIYEAIRLKDFPSEEETVEICSKIKSKVLTALDKEYPEWLRRVYKPPFILFYYGDLSLLQNQDKNLAIVGSRDNTEYGKETTFNLVKEIRARYVVVSGLARGIDSIAHEAAINNGGKTVGILGSGIDKCWPSENLSIYKKMKKEHLVISEYPGTTEPNPKHFPMRNRLIAGISKAVLVTEAKERSGTLITVGYALNASKDIMCVPYPIGSESSCNRLISEGAYLVQSGQDIVDIMK